MSTGSDMCVVSGGVSYILPAHSWYYVYSDTGTTQIRCSLATLPFLCGDHFCLCCFVLTMRVANNLKIT
jgi:hypothetical protein